MLIYKADFNLHKNSLSKEPRWVAAIDFSGAGDWHYFTSHADALLPAGLTVDQYTHSTLKIRSLASQTLDPKKALATIGKIAFDLLDINGAITALLQTKLDAGNGLNKKTVRIYKGFAEHTDFATQYELVETQVVSKSITFDRISLSWKINCSDAQRLLKQNLFELAKTNITATVEEGDTTTTINVGSTAAFELFEHDAGYDDAPSATVGYLKLKRSSSEFEIVRYTGKTATSFTGVTRGVMGSKPLKHEFTTGDEADRQIEVEEYVYLEGPILKIAYAILTGSLYGQAGKTLPSGWHLGIDTQFVSTASFTGIGADVWDTTDPTAGHQCRFQGIAKQEGKKFLESELMLLSGCFHTVLNDGQLAVRRMADAAADASTLGTLDAANIISATQLENSLSDIANLYSITWNWEDLLGKYTRQNILADGDSIATHQLGDIKEYTFRGMYGNRMTVDRIYGRFDSLRHMYAGPPLRLSVKTLGIADEYEVGDTVRVTLGNLRDFTNGTQHSLDRAFMVFGKTVEAATGQVTYNLFGSSQKASAMPAPSIQGLGAVLPDSFYSSGLNPANNIQTMALAVDPLNGFEVIGGVGILKVDITCTGVAGNVNHTDSIFWYDGDLEIASGVTVTVVNGAQFRVRGFFENKGTISGKGGGIAGVSGYSIVGTQVTAEGFAPGNAGTPGFIGTTQGGGGMWFVHSFKSNEAIGGNTVMPPINIEWNGSALVGIPADMRGTSGGGGGAVFRQSTWSYVSGGAGGNGGAPVVIISRGFSNNLTTGSINVSGNDGGSGALVSNPSYDTYSGSGAGGCPGGVLFVIDGATNGVTGTSVITANRGATPINGTPVSAPSISRTGPQPQYSYFVGTQAEAMSTAVVAITYVVGEQTPQPDVPQTTGDDTATTLAVLNNTPKTIKGDICTIEITANNAGGSNYSYSVAYYRVKGTTQWTRINPPASPETVVQVVADGTTYEVITHSVSTAGVESPSGTMAEITVPNVTAPSMSDTAPSALDNLTIPNVTGLELFEQANNTLFTGRDAKFAWRKTSATEVIPLANEPTGLGAGSGTMDAYFQDWRVRMYSGNTLLRTESVTDNWYVYSYEKNAEDYQRINGTPGAYREFTIEVVVRVRYSAEVSPIPARLTVSNPAPAAPGGLSLRATFAALHLDFSLPADNDFKGVLVWLGESTGFTRSAATLVTPATGITGNKLIIDKKPDGSPLAAGTQYFVVIQACDEFGLEGTESVELTATTLKIDGEFDIAHQSIKTANIGLAQITNATVNDMAVDKLTSGNFTGKYINITSGGNIRSGKTSYTDTANGFFIGDVGGTPKISIIGVADYLNIDTGVGGGFEYSGTITASSFYAGSSTFGGAGIQLEYNSGSPRAYFGNGIDNFIQYTSAGVEVGEETEIIGVDAYSNNSHYFHTFFESTEAAYKQTIGGASIAHVVTLSQGYLQLASGGTSGDRAHLVFIRQLNAGVGMFGGGDFSKKRKLKIIASASFDSSSIIYFGG